jgi:energy-coupling factor transporter ATP-binding protein EcfA2
MPDHSVCPTRLLDDAPTDRDEFGSHEPVAEAIRDLVVHEQGGRAIGLAGSWGSGKSTVVRLLQQIAPRGADGQLDVRVIEFDAWAHQGDPLRRTFLEQLVSALSDCGWTSAQAWAGDLQALARRVSIQDQTNTSVLTPQAKCLVGSSLFVPLGLALVSTFGTDTVSAWWPWIGVIMALLPAAAFVYLLAARKWRTWPFNMPRPLGRDAATESLTAILAGHTQVTTRSETIQTADPTSVEFQALFRRLLRDVLGSGESAGLGEKRRLVLAIDNLDRVGITEGLSVWATMRAFLEVPRKDQEWLKRLWVLVPYDHDGIARLWRGENSDAEQLAAPFLEKTFQVRFRIPRPVLSDARAFMVRLLAEAMPKHPEADRDHVYRIYEFYNSLPIPTPDQDSDRQAAGGEAARASKVYPTPRDIKMFVNDLGTVHRQWCGRIPLSDQVLFTLLIRDGLSPLDPRSMPVRGDSRLTSMTSGELGQNLAGMHFNLEPTKALQVYLAPLVLLALTAADSAGLSQYAKNVGFLDICGHVITAHVDSWRVGDSRDLAYAAVALNGVDVAFDADLRWHTIWRQLRTAAARATQWDITDSVVVDGLTALMDNAPAPFVEALLTAVSATPVK